MTDDNRERIRITQNVIAAAVNACNRAVQYIEAEWSKEEYDLFIGSAATEAFLEFAKALSMTREKADAVGDELEKRYRE